MNPERGGPCIQPCVREVGGADDRGKLKSFQQWRAKVYHILNVSTGLLRILGSIRISYYSTKLKQAQRRATPFRPPGGTNLSVWVLPTEKPNKRDGDGRC